MVEAGAEDAFEAGVELGEQAAYPVAGAGGLGGEVLVEADEDREFGGDLVGEFQRAQGVRQGAGRVRDDRGVLGVGLGLARIQVGDPPHGQAGQVGDLAAGVPGDSQGEGADGGGLVHDHQDGAELGGELVEDGPQSRLAVGQLLVEDLLPGRREPMTVMGTLADVQAEEHAHVFGVEHRAPPGGLNVPAPAVVSYARIHVMQTCRPRAVRHCAGPGGGRTSHQRLRRHLPGPVTPPPRSCLRQGGTVMPGPEASGPLAGPRKT